MSNWFKKISQIDDDLEEEEFDQLSVSTRYRLIFPIDIWFKGSGNPERDKWMIYQEIKNALKRGLSNAVVDSYSEYFQPSDVKTYDEVLRESGL